MTSSLNDCTLLPCPFCGGEALPEKLTETVARVRCKSCGASTDHNLDAAAAWNARAHPTPEPLDGTDWHIVEEDGKSYVKVEFGVFVAYRKKMGGRPAVPGKPLEIQTRDELLAYIRQMEAKPQEDMLANLRAENERLRAALRPFAAKAQLCRDYEHEPETSGVWEFRAGNFYTAEQALTSQDGGANG